MSAFFCFKEVMMENSKYFKEFVRYASLNVLGMLGISCYILADTFFISQGLGSDGLTGVESCDSCI